MDEDELKEDARNLCDQIREIIKCLDQTHRNVNIANSIGSGAGVLGGVVFGVGALLVAPPLAVIGAAAGAVGALVNIGSNTTEHFVTKRYISKVQENWEEIQHKLAAFFMERLGSENSVISILLTIKDIIECTVSLKDGWDLIRNKCLQTENPLQMALRSQTLEGAVVLTRMAASGSKVANAMRVERTAVNIANIARGVNRAYQGVKMVGRVSFALNTILLPLNVYDLYSSASGAIKGEPSEASAKLGRIEEFLDKFATGKLLFNFHVTE